MSLTNQLVTLVRNKSISDQDLEQATLFVLDAVVNSIAGANTAPGRILTEWVASQTNNDAARQAFVAGGLAHILELDDLHRTSVTHPGCVVVPASIAVSVREGASGLELLKSVLHGFEAMCRVGMAVGREHYRIWHNTATCGPFGSAMAIATLQNLSQEEAVHALGNAGTQSGGVWQFLATGAMSKHLHAGRGAEAGIVAADLAKHGFTGPPEILEGEKGFFAATCTDADPDAVIRHPHAPWQLTQTSIKPWPCCRHTHPIIDAALELYPCIEGKDICEITVETYQAVLDVCDRPTPTSEYEAKFSAHHCIAAALSYGRVDFSSFTNEARAQLSKLREKVKVTVSEPFISAYPESWGTKIMVKTTDGNLFSAERSTCKGDPENMLNKEEMVNKARYLLSYAGFEEPDATEFIETFLNMKNEETVPDVLNWTR
jgi:2-methylcitrate dehydratase PrpD